MKKYTFEFASYSKPKNNDKDFDTYESVINSEFKNLNVVVFQENYSSAEDKAKEQVSEVIDKIYKKYRVQGDYIHLKLKVVEELQTDS